VLISCRKAQSAKTSEQLCLTIVQSIGMAIFFGLLHQAGTIPAMLSVHSQLPGLQEDLESMPFQLLFWRSFMPPRHLILPALRGAKAILVDDCRSMSVINLASKISDSISKTIIFMPSWTRTEETMSFFRDHDLTFTRITKNFLHLDTDHLGESVAAYRQGQSLWQSFSYAAYRVQKSVK
jgi:phosphatidylinositol glycan class Z